MSANARVTVTLEIDFNLSQPWSDETSISQLRKQAHDGAEQMAQRLVDRLNGDGTKGTVSYPERVRRIVLVGKEVTMVLPRESK